MLVSFSLSPFLLPLLLPFSFFPFSFLFFHHHKTRYLLTISFSFFCLFSRSILHRIPWMTRIPSKLEKVIHNEKQLQLEQTLEQCDIKNDSPLHIVGHLHNGLYPAASKIVNYIVTILAHMRSRCYATLSSPRHTCEASNMVKVITTCRFNLPGFSEVFRASKGPFILSSLYAPPSRSGMCNRELAEACIRTFLSCSRAKTS